MNSFIFNFSISNIPISSSKSKLTIFITNVNFIKKNDGLAFDVTILYRHYRSGCFQKWVAKPFC